MSTKLLVAVSVARMLTEPQDCVGVGRLARPSPAGWASDPSTEADWNYRGLRWLAELCLKFRNPSLGCLKPLEQRSDQRVLLGVAQLAEVGRMGHPKLESSRS
jgi:hypothetical protein